MIRIDEEVEPVIRIPIELREYVELEDAERALKKAKDLLSKEAV